MKPVESVLLQHICIPTQCVFEWVFFHYHLCILFFCAYWVCFFVNVQEIMRWNVGHWNCIICHEILYVVSGTTSSFLKSIHHLLQYVSSFCFTILHGHLRRELLLFKKIFIIMYDASSFCFKKSSLWFTMLWRRWRRKIWLLVNISEHHGCIKGIDNDFDNDFNSSDWVSEVIVSEKKTFVWVALQYVFHFISGAPHHAWRGVLRRPGGGLGGGGGKKKIRKLIPVSLYGYDLNGFQSLSRW